MTSQNGFDHRQFACKLSMADLYWWSSLSKTWAERSARSFTCGPVLSFFGNPKFRGWFKEAPEGFSAKLGFRDFETHLHDFPGSDTSFDQQVR